MLVRDMVESLLSWLIRSVHRMPSVVNILKEICKWVSVFIEIFDTH